MRISTMARLKGAVILFAVLALASQYAFAQLPIETRDIRLQGANSGEFIRISAGTVTTNYTLTYPNAVGAGPGAFLFLTSSGGQFAWSEQATTSGHIPVWSGTTIRWVGADDGLFPVWSLNGNRLDAANKKLGSINGQPFDIVTNNNTRVTFASDGAISINTTATGGASTTVGRATGHTTTIDGTTNINGGSNTGVTTIGNTAAVSVDVLAATATINNNAGTGVTNIGTGSTTGTVTIGGSSAQVIDIGTGDAAKTVLLGSTNGSSTTTLSSGSGGLNLNVGNNQPTNINSGSSTGAVTIGGTGTQDINIGNGNGAKTVNLGSSNTTSTTNILGGSGSVNINVATASNTNINTTSGVSTIAIGNANSTLNVLGATNINTSGSALTSIGNSGAAGSDTRFSGEIQMETDPGDAGDVLISSGTNNTPQWKNLNDAIGIRAAGNVTVTNNVVTATINAPGLVSTDAILITLQTASTTSAVTATVTDRNDGADTFTVTFSAQYTGVVNYLVIKTL